MKNAHDIIIRPIITEESLAATKKLTYTFEVMSGSTKPEIATAVEEAFGVEVVKVNTVSMKKKPRSRTNRGYTGGGRKQSSTQTAQVESSSRRAEF